MNAQDFDINEIITDTKTSHIPQLHDLFNIPKEAMAHHYKSEIIALLLGKGAVVEFTETSCTLLEKAFEGDNIEIVQLLVAKLAAFHR